MFNNKRKGQEEIVGFVLIVVIITIIFVIFLGIKLRNPEPTQRESEIIYQFLESAMKQTTECVLNTNGRRVSLDELIKECQSTNTLCENGENSCDAAKETMTNMLNNTWKVGENYPTKGYEATVIYSYNSTSQTQNEEVFAILVGNCSNSFSGNSYFIPQFPGSIVVNAKLCN